MTPVEKARRGPDAERTRAREHRTAAATPPEAGSALGPVKTVNGYADPASGPAIVPLTHRCNNNCIFCPLSGEAGRPPEPTPSARRALLDSIVQSRRSSVALVGGEPTLLDDLPGIVHRLRDAGTSSVLLQTNARRLTYASYLRALVQAGLSSVEISLHGARAEIHEFHTRTPGSFRQTVNGLRAAVHAGIEVTVTSVVTRSSFRHLRELVRLVASTGAEVLHLSIARPFGTAEALLPSVVPRLLLVGPHVQRATDVGAEVGLTVTVGGLVPCVLGRRLPALMPPVVAALGGVFGPACNECGARRACKGLDPRYAARYGFGETRPIAPEEIPHRRSRNDALARLPIGLSVVLGDGEDQTRVESYLG